MQDRIFYASSFGFIFGILFASIFDINFYLNIFLLIISFVFLLNFIFLFKNKWGIIISSFLLLISFGIFYFNYFNSNTDYKFLEYRVGQELELRGEIVDDIIHKEKNDTFIFETKDDNSNRKTRILVSTDLESGLFYGDVVLVSGKLKKVENFLTDTGKEFDYVNYLKKDGVYYLLPFAKVEVIDENQGNLIKKFLFRVKNSFIDKINFIIPPYQSTLLNGLLLGDRSQFPEDLKEAFIKTGTIHIVALSGYNVSIISLWFMRILGFLPFTYAIFGGVLVIILFVLMTGAYMTSIRAGIMAILVLFARYLGREYEVLRALVITFVLMLLFNPYVLYFDISFQLSFIATLGVIFLTPKIEKYFNFVTPVFNLRDIVAVTFSAYIFVLPFILYKMGTLSLVALPVNILVLPLIPLIMLLGFFSGFLGFIFLPLGLGLGYLSYLLLSYEISIIQFFGSLPFASFTFPDFPLFLTISIYLYFTYFLFWAKIKGFFNDDFTFY